MNGIDHTILDNEFTKSIVALSGGEFVTECAKGVFEPIERLIKIKILFFEYKYLHFCVDFAVDFESIKSLKDGIVIIST